MRKLLFKARKTEDGSWIEGQGISYGRSASECYLEILANNRIKWVSVQSDTISISIGLSDMDNRMIFENDMIETEDNRIKGIIKYGSYKQNLSSCDLEYETQGFYIDWIADDMNNWNDWMRQDICFWKDKIRLLGSKYVMKME